MLVQKCNYTCVLFVFLCWLSAWCWSEILRWSKFLRKFREKKSHLLLCMRSTNKIKASNSKPFWCRWDFRIFNLGKVRKIWRALHWKTSPTNQPTPEGVRARRKRAKEIGVSIQKLRILSCLYLWHASLKGKTSDTNCYHQDDLHDLRRKRILSTSSYHNGILGISASHRFFPNFQLPEKPHDLVVTLDHFDWTPCFPNVAPLRILA